MHLEGEQAFEFAVLGVVVDEFDGDLAVDLVDQAVALGDDDILVPLGEIDLYGVMFGGEPLGGLVVDDDALVEALKNRKIAAAGLDVFNGEPDGIHPEYRKLENTFLLPHIGSATEETREAMGFRVIDNLLAIFNNQQPGDRVA